MPRFDLRGQDAGPRPTLYKASFLDGAMNHISYISGPSYHCNLYYATSSVVLEVESGKWISSAHFFRGIDLLVLCSSIVIHFHNRC